MDTVAIPFAEWLATAGSATLDTVVIGSGYGGAVAALRLAEVGVDVVVLERGSEYLPGEFPNEIGQLTKFQRFEGPKGPMGRPAGLFNWRIGSSFAALVGNGVGGGSLINAGVAMRPQDEVFSQSAWPAQIRYRSDRHAGLTLQTGFKTAETTLRVDSTLRETKTYPAFPKAQALKRMGKALEGATEDDVPVTAADLTIDHAKCTRCGDCFTGCNVPGAKLTLRETYLRHAFSAGATIVANALVWTIEPQDDGGWILHCISTERSTYHASVEDSVRLEGVSLRARNVVVSAGTFGSTELLQRSKHRYGERFRLSPALGTRLSGNGDSLSASIDEPSSVDALGRGSLTATPGPDVGSTITSIIDLRSNPNLRRRLVIQEGAVPGALVDAFQEILATTWTLNHIGSIWKAPRSTRGNDPLGAPLELAGHTQLLLTMGHDSANGRIVFMPDMDASVPYWVDPEGEETYKYQTKILAKASEALGGKHMFSPLWQLLPPRTTQALGGNLAPPTTLTVHPLGGCPMGDDFETGVVNHKGQVFSRAGSVYETLLVLDGSIIPTSLGCNPLLTITALAERAMAYRTSGRAMTPGKPRRSTTPRNPVPLQRETTLTYAVNLSERLVAPDLVVGGRLGSAFGTATVQAALEVTMRTRDWAQVWRSNEHRLVDIRGKLVLHAPSTAQRATYRIATGSIELLGRRASLEPQFLSTLRAAITWLILRGARDIARYESTTTLGEKLQSFLGLWAMWRQAGADKRFVSYDLNLELAYSSETRAPANLRLAADKDIQYAASWSAMFAYFVRRFIFRRKLLAGDLRRTYVEQLTDPLIALSEPGWRGAFTRALPLALTSTRFHFDQRFALGRSPASLVGGGDSGSAPMLLAAYPAMVLRHALKTRLFDFRLPDYSGRQMVDHVKNNEPVLRSGPAGAKADVVPDFSSVCVRRGRSTADDGTEPIDNIWLPMWRYRRTNAAGEKCDPGIESGHWYGVPVRRARSVLLMHAFGMSGSTFTLHEVRTNLAEFLYAQGYEVWIFDSRMSPRVGGSLLQGTLDQVGLIDAVAAVDHILDALGGTAVGQEPLQIFSFAHCLGSGAMLVGLLGGKLSYVDHTFDAQRRVLPKLAALVCSQVHPFMVGSNTSMSKTWVAPAARDIFHRVHVPLAARSAAPNALEQIIDRIFASLPVPPGERCPHEGTIGRKTDNDCATCRRIRFLDGELFKHDNLNERTHTALPSLFGSANVRLFAHGSKMLDYERLVSEDGLNTYATDEALARYLTLPIRFIHSSLNELFNVESATRSSAQFKRINPELSAQFGANGTDLCHDIVGGYGHLDLLIGKDLELGRDGKSPVYAQLTALFDLVWRHRHHQPPPSTKPPAEVADVRFPAAGPWISPVYECDGQRRVNVAFVVDDLTERAAATGSTLNASAIIHDRLGSKSVVALEIVPFTAPLAARDGFVLSPRPNDPHLNVEKPVTVRIARGSLPAPPPGEPLRAELVTYADFRRLGARQRVPAARRSHSTGEAKPSDSVEQPYTAKPQSVAPGTLDAAITKTRTRVHADRVDGTLPYPESLSPTRREPLRASTRWLHVRAGLLDVPGADDEVRIAVGSCRYPGLPFDRDRADQTFERMVRHARASRDDRPHVALMLGDQIYADASARLADPMGGIERFHRKHLLAFTTPWMRRLMASTPTVLTPDDHEFTDNYPLAAPLFSGNATDRRYAALREFALRSAASDAVKAFQFATYSPSNISDGCNAFSIGDVRLMVVDTRTHREVASPGITTLSMTQRQAIQSWLAAGSPTSLHVLCSGSVVVPSLVTGTDPASPGKSDSWGVAAGDQQWLLGTLKTHAAGRFVLVSGDYHVTTCAEILDGNSSVGLAVVAPPLYAPLLYANAQPSDVCSSEATSIPGGSLVSTKLGPSLTGSGYGLLRLKPDLNAPGGWRVTVDVDVDALDGRGWSGLQTLASWPTAPVPTAQSGPEDFRQRKRWQRPK